MSSKLSATMLDALKRIADAAFVRWPGGFWQRPDARVERFPYEGNKVPEQYVSTGTIVALWRRKLIELDGPPNGHGSNGTKATITHEGRIAAGVSAHPLTPVEEGVPSGSGWMPIESAPKDGTRVLVFVPPYGPTTAHNTFHNFGGEPADNWHLHACLNKEAVPTHWMSLPPAPGEAPSPSKERVEKLEAALKEASFDVHAAAEALESFNHPTLAAFYFKAAERHRALLETEGK